MSDKIDEMIDQSILINTSLKIILNLIMKELNSTNKRTFKPSSLTPIY